MNKRSGMVVAVFFFAVSTAVSWAQNSPLIVGPNINMVAGTEWPGGDPFLRQQNEPSVDFSSRNKLHLLAGSNDYRTVDLPGTPEDGATGDSWISYYWTTNGGVTWKSNLIPGYPQDNSEEGLSSPLKGFAAGADPVIRAGTHGMFYYSGIAFDRSENPRSSIFVARFIDLNNDEGGAPIRYIDTTLVDISDSGDRFLDKSWIAVDLPRAGAQEQTFVVTQSDGGTVEQTVQCGHIYVAYAALSGEEDELRSDIMLTSSLDCGTTWTEPYAISEEDTLNQGASIAINPMNGNVHIGWRRFDTIEAFLGTPAQECTKEVSDWARQGAEQQAVAWPVDNVGAGGLELTREQALDLLAQNPRRDDSVRLAQFLVAAKLNLLLGTGLATPSFDPLPWIQTLGEIVADADQFFIDRPLSLFQRNGSNSFRGARLNRAGKALSRGQRDNLENHYLSPEPCSAAPGGGGTPTDSSNAMVATLSSDFGESFAAPVDVAEIRTFDQGGTYFSFRNTAFPSMAVDAFGRAYLVYAARGFGSVRPSAEQGDSRIVLSTSSDGLTWSPPYPIDDDPVQAGHQIKPSILFAGGKLLVVYYDLRQDVSGLYERFILDVPEPSRLRHTMDVRVATASTFPGPVTNPVFTNYAIVDGERSQQGSRYAYIITRDPDTGADQTVQLQYMVPNLPTHGGGTQPFIGDYVDVAAKVFLKDGEGWRYATQPGDVDVYTAVWTDNRDIVPPPDGDWTQYRPPNLPGQTGSRPSVFDPSQSVSCDPSGQDGQYTGSRNQNVYSALLTDGLIVAAPGGGRPLGQIPASTQLLQRAYVVFTQNVTMLERFFRLSVQDPVSGDASFDQFEPTSSVVVMVPPYSSAVRTVFARSANPFDPITVTVIETSADGALLPGGLASQVVLNSDPSAPLPLNEDLLSAETHTPSVLNPSVLNPSILNPSVFNPSVLNPSVFNSSVFNPSVFNPSVFNSSVFNPSVLNPSVFNSSVFNPSVLNPSVLNPSVLNPSILNPSVLNPSVFNAAVANPSILNPSVFNPSVFNATVESVAAEVTFPVTNSGNATSAYDITLAAQQEEDGLTYQVMVYRLNRTPIASGCELVEEAQQELITNVFEPSNGADPGSGEGQATFYVEPGDEVIVTVLVLPDYSLPMAEQGDPRNVSLDDILIAIGIVPQAVDTVAADIGETQPTPTPVLTPAVPILEILSSELPSGLFDESYLTQLEFAGGTGAVTWSLPPGSPIPLGLSLSADGEIDGFPQDTGIFEFNVRASDGIQEDTALLSVEILDSGGGALALGEFSLIDGFVGLEYVGGPATATGGNPPYFFFDLTDGPLPPGINMDGDGNFSGVPTSSITSVVRIGVADTNEDFASSTFSFRIRSEALVGGGGGIPFQLNCPEFQVAIGIRGFAGSEVEQTELICSPVTAYSQGFPVVSGAEFSGGIASTDDSDAGVSYGDTLMCGSPTVMNGINISERSGPETGNSVDQMGVTCARDNLVSNDSALVAAPNDTGLLQRLRCPAGSWVVGLQGRTGNFIHAIGPICGAQVPVINAMSPEIDGAAAAAGQMVYLSGSYFPGSVNRPRIVVSQGANSYQGFVLGWNENGYLARIPSQILESAGPAQIQVRGSDQVFLPETPPLSPPFTFSVAFQGLPPEILAGPADPLVPGGPMTITAYGIDTSNVQARFVQAGQDTLFTSASSTGNVPSTPETGISANFTVPAATLANQTVDISIRAIVNGVAGEWSVPVTVFLIP